MARITGVRARALLDDYDHQLSFPAEWPFIIMYGPNGVGKTKLLQAVYYLSSRRFSSLVTIPFKWLEISYEDGARITATRGTYLLDEITEELGQSLLIELHEGHDAKPIRYTYYASRSSEIRHLMEKETPWREIGLDEWRDLRDGEIIDWFELQNRSEYRAVQRRHRIKEDRRRPPEKEEMPTRIESRLAKSPVHFIATQRLMYSESRTDYENTRRDTISQYAADMLTRLGRAQSGNSFRAQQLDRTFPQRILTTYRPESSEASIRAHYQRQNERRKVLGELGLVDAQADIGLPDTEMEPWQRHVLQTYLDDTDERLGTFTHTVDRATLFLDIMNTRFTNKFVRASTEVGIEIVRKVDGKTIPPSDLSSGEQHELVLIYDLIFNVPQNALVLIDEPEISLHVAWQKSFTRDIERVAQLADLRFMIATHSPQIINKSWNRTARLGGLDRDGGES